MEFVSECRMKNRYVLVVIAAIPLALTGCRGGDAAPDLAKECAQGTFVSSAPNLTFSVAEMMTSGPLDTCLMSGGTNTFKVLDSDGRGPNFAEAVSTDRSLPSGCTVTPGTEVYVWWKTTWYHARNAVCSGAS